MASAAPQMPGHPRPVAAIAGPLPRRPIALHGDRRRAGPARVAGRPAALRYHRCMRRAGHRGPGRPRVAGDGRPQAPPPARPAESARRAQSSPAGSQAETRSDYGLGHPAGPRRRRRNPGVVEAPLPDLPDQHPRGGLGDGRAAGGAGHRRTSAATPGCSTRAGSSPTTPPGSPTSTPRPGSRSAPSGDLLGDAIEEAHKQGVRVIARCDFSKLHRDQFEQHPDWFFVSRERPAAGLQGALLGLPLGAVLPGEVPGGDHGDPGPLRGGRLLLQLVRDVHCGTTPGPTTGSASARTAGAASARSRGAWRCPRRRATPTPATPCGGATRRSCWRRSPGGCGR